MLKFHPNFKSANPKITKASTLNIKLGDIWQYQYLFDRYTTPHEIKQWDKQELSSFKIEYSQIDRLYIFMCSGWSDDSIYYDVMFRMKYKDESDIYVHLIAECTLIDDDDNESICGSFYISRDVKIFMGILLNEYENLDNVYKLLEYDDIYIKTYIKNNKRYEIKKCALKLKTICYESIYDNLHKLKFQITDIPRNLFKIIDHMIKFREARDAYKHLDIINYHRVFYYE